MNVTLRGKINSDVGLGPPGNSAKWINMQKTESLWNAYKMSVTLYLERIGVCNTAGNMSQGTTPATVRLLTRTHAKAAAVSSTNALLRVSFFYVCAPLCVRLQCVVCEWAAWSCPCPAYCCCRFTQLYKNTLSATERNGDTHITVDKMSQHGSSLSISVQDHYETEIVFAHSWCQAGSCLDKNKIFNDEKRKAVGHFSPHTECLELWLYLF